MTTHFRCCSAGIRLLKCCAANMKAPAIFECFRPRELFLPKTRDAPWNSNPNCPALHRPGVSNWKRDTTTSLTLLGVLSGWWLGPVTAVHFFCLPAPHSVEHVLEDMPCIRGTPQTLPVSPRSWRWCVRYPSPVGGINFPRQNMQSTSS